jgi:hypothetical protein
MYIKIISAEPRYIHILVPLPHDTNQAQGEIQPHPHGAILRHLLHMVISFLCSSTNFFKNRLLPNNLIIVRNHEDDEDDKWDIKRVLERQNDARIKVEI